jgi:predicted metal-binding protein
MNDEMIQAARAAFKKNPEAACKAILGCSPDELFCEAVKAARGCNQHGHKPGCPDAVGGVSPDDFDRILKSYEAKSPEARKQEREAQLNRTLRDYQNAVGESASDSEVKKLWKNYTDTESLYKALDERLAKKRER